MKIAAGVIAPAKLMFWSCLQINRFGSGVYRTLSEVMDLEVEPKANVSIFGTIPFDHSRLSRYKIIIAFSTLIARHQILLHWKSPHPPKLSM